MGFLTTAFVDGLEFCMQWCAAIMSLPVDVITVWRLRSDEPFGGVVCNILGALSPSRPLLADRESPHESG